MKEALEGAKKTATEAKVEVLDLNVQVKQEKALRVELEGWLARAQSQTDSLETQLEAQKEITAQWRELY